MRNQQSNTRVWEYSFLKFNFNLYDVMGDQQTQYFIL